jgi:hypothetical protein
VLLELPAAGGLEADEPCCFFAGLEELAVEPDFGLVAAPGAVGVPAVCAGVVVVLLVPAGADAGAGLAGAAGAECVCTRLQPVTAATPALTNSKRSWRDWSIIVASIL